MCWAEPVKVGDRVRERAWRVPEGCEPFVARAESVAPDGWVCVTLGPRSFSFAPHEIEKVEGGGVMPVFTAVLVTAPELSQG